MPSIAPVLFPGPRFSVAELRAACLDGELIPFGAGYLPADAPTPPFVRAAAIAPCIASSYAFVRLTAAWIHGATDELGDRWEVQRAVPWQTTRIVDRRIRYRDQELPPEDGVVLAGATVSTPSRTLADLARDAVRPDPVAHDAAIRLAADASACRGALAWFDAHPRRTHAVAAVAFLRSVGAAGDDRGQDDVTR
ncbi:hypothetical protein N8K70_09035 [Microbacterium betulae]|uniref:AbiEi antitoxin C-terminal domain-containing protein n=1 Tax=Microbacterium betulae TaxID=2981139 RepID=A0AA97I3K6_9MICO|nr:hypothetical protein [Microbacterium sp. AB]WOF21541.1 hypothetical protein N8K70_09035 [Microbacterium sp. AB]